MRIAGIFILGLVWGVLFTNYYYTHRGAAAVHLDAKGNQLHAAVVTNKTVVATPQKLAATAAPLTQSSQLKHPFEQYSELDETTRSMMIAEIAAMGDQGVVPKYQVVAALQILLAREPEQGLREDILDAIAATGDPSAFEALLGVLQAEAPEAMHAAAMTALTQMMGSLAEAEDNVAFEELCRSLDADIPKPVREAAIEALLLREDKRAIPYLQPLLVDPDEDIRTEAQDAIEYLTDV